LRYREGTFRLKIANARAREKEFARQQAIQADAGWHWDLQDDVDFRPWRRITCDYLLLHVDICGLLHAAALAAQIAHVKLQATNPCWIIGLESVQRKRIDVMDASALKQASVPRLVASRAPVDKPGIQALAVCVQPDFAAAAQQSDAGAAIAGEPYLGGDFGVHGPLNPKSIGHVDLAFPMGSSSSRRRENAVAGSVNEER